MRLSVVLDLRGLRAAKQGQITNHWEKPKHCSYWFKQIKGKQLSAWSFHSSAFTSLDTQGLCYLYSQIPQLISHRTEMKNVRIFCLFRAVHIDLSNTISWLWPCCVKVAWPVLSSPWANKWIIHRQSKRNGVLVVLL